MFSIVFISVGAIFCLKFEGAIFFEGAKALSRLQKKSFQTKNHGKGHIRVYIKISSAYDKDKAKIMIIY